eukprot:SAG22_NODE_4662_length_1201_cov_0.999093_2_plen_232_part_00
MQYGNVGKDVLIVPGTGGLIDFDSVLQTLCKHGFSGPVVIEKAPGSTAAEISANFIEARRFVDGVLGRAAAAVAASITAAPAAKQSGATLPLLSDAQVCSFIKDGYIQIDTTVDLGTGYHRDLYDRCRALSDGDGADTATRFIFPQIPELSDVCECPATKGALTSLLGPDYVQYPHRTQHRCVRGREGIVHRAPALCHSTGCTATVKALTCDSAFCCARCSRPAGGGDQAW